ncbi:MAG: hypothetical protein M1405_00250 [Patescibacteria group bacterium]|nr:hypothetical protein [Patescibacteria group bacterium]
MAEAQSYNYQRPRELADSKNFAVEYAPIVNRREIEDDIIAYLGEFRFGLKKSDYRLVFSRTDDEGWRLRDPHRLESMAIKAQRAITERRQRGEITPRETAEASGLNFLDQQLQTASEEGSIVWASPPGAESQGYGDYGFFYIGQIGRMIANRREVAMTAIRVNGRSLPDYEKAFKRLSGIDFKFKNPEDFLRMPVILNDSLPKELIDSTLGTIFPNQENVSDNSVEFQLAIARIKNRIGEFIDYCAFATPTEKAKAFHALENYFLEVREEIRSGKTVVYQKKREFKQLVADYGSRKTPEVKGSCPISSQNPLNSSNIFNGGFEALNNLINQEWFTCPKCHYKADGPVGNTCPGCGLTKEAYAQESGQICE